MAFMADFMDNKNLHCSGRKYFFQLVETRSLFGQVRRFHKLANQLPRELAYEITLLKDKYLKLVVI